MFLKILKMILYFFIIFAKPVYADNFDSTIDTSSNQFFQTIAWGVNGYPQIAGIEYKKADFVGVSTSSILSSNIEAFTDFDFTRRIPMVSDLVNAPPGTQVDIVYLYKNSTGHSVNISKVDWVLSRNIRENGDLTNILEIPGYTEGNLTYKYSNQTLTKYGIYKEYAGIGNISNGGVGTYMLDTVVIKNPLNIDDVKALENENGGVDVEIYIQNSSNEYFENIKFTYGTYEASFNIPALQEHVVQFSIPSIPVEMGIFSIYNPNIKQICAVYGSPYYTYTQTDAIPVLAYRGANIVPGAMVMPQRESFCIKRIPYTMISEPIVLSRMVVEEEEEENEVLDTIPIETEVETELETQTEDKAVEEKKGEDEEEVLGTSSSLNAEEIPPVLPKTGKGLWQLPVLLVVDVLLWYSVYILRRNYESKNTNSRVCTKSK